MNGSVVYNTSDWWVLERRERVAANYCHYRDRTLEVGDTIRLFPPRRKKGGLKPARVRLRVKSIFRYRVYARFYHVVTDLNRVVVNHKEALIFKTKAEAIAAGKLLTGT